MPKVSVIIPVYNCEKFISETLDSVFAQTFKDFEVIVVDSSTDNTRAVIRQYEDRYPGKIRYFFQSRCGIPAARNFGLKESCGEYVGIIEDDVWLPEKLACQVKLMDENTDAALIYTDSEVFDDDKIIRCSCSRSASDKRPGGFRWQIMQKEFNDGSILKADIFIDMLEGNLMEASSVLMRKEYLRNIGVFDTTIFCDDFDYWFRISEQYPIIFLNKVLTRYRYREDSTSGRKGLREVKYEESFAAICENALKRRPELRGVLLAKVSHLYRSACWGYLSFVQLTKVRQLAIKSLTYNKWQPKVYVYVLLSFLPRTLFVWLKNRRRVMKVEHQ